MARNNSLNFNRLSKYNFRFISIDEVILLEYLTFHHQKDTLDTVVHSKVESDTGIKRSKQFRIFEELKEKGFVSWEFNGSRNFYTLHINKIIDSLPKLFARENKFVMQYFYYAQNPNAFSKKKTKKVTASKVSAIDVSVQEVKGKEKKEKPKPKEQKSLENQMSLF